MKNSFLLILCGILLVLSGCTSRRQHEHVKRPGPLDGTEQTALKRALKTAGIGDTVSDIPVDKLAMAQDYFMQLGWVDLERKVLLRRIKISKDPQEIAALMTQHGELELAEGNYEKAKAIFTTYKQLYLGDIHLKRVLYGELIAHVETLRAPDRDQSGTRVAIALARHYIEEFPDDDEYLMQVIALLVDCYERLLTSELLQMRFYMRRFEIDGASGALMSVERRVRGLGELVLKDLSLFAYRFKTVLEAVEQYAQQPVGEIDAPAHELQQRAQAVEKLLAQAEQQLYFSADVIAPKRSHRKL